MGYILDDQSTNTTPYPNRMKHPESADSTTTDHEPRECLTLAHSTITIESGPAGTLARIDRDGESPDYAGPLPRETITALREVAR